MNSVTELFDKVIYTYTRAQAIADGVLCDVSEMAKEAGLKFPVAVTSIIWELYIEWLDEDNKKQTYQDTNGRLWDILWMLRCAIRCNKNTNCILYQLHVVPRNGKTKKAKLVTLKAIIDAGDNGEPVITIMQPNED